MSNIQHALDALGKMTRVVKAFEDAEVVLKELAGAEQNRKEIADSLSELKNQYAALADEVAKTKESLRKIKADARSAEKETAEFAEVNRQKVESELAIVQESATKMLADTKSQLDQMNAEIGRLADVKVKAESEISTLNQAIADARQKFASLLG
jgi:chromosome segregation ATPase